jgi:glycosyltransferase involved in cell wall biosynthesis
MPRISVVIPVYNDKENLEFAVKKLKASLGEIGCSYEILIA